MSKIHTKMVGQLQAHDQLTEQENSETRRQWMTERLRLNSQLNASQRDAVREKLEQAKDDDERLDIIDQAWLEYLFGAQDTEDKCYICGAEQCSH